MKWGIGMYARRAPRFLLFSILFHAFIFALLAIGFEFSSPIPVLQNTNKQNTINVVILGDTADSKVLPQKAMVKPVEQTQEDKTKTKPQRAIMAQPVPKPEPTTKVKPDVIAIKTDVEKKMMEAKALEEKKKLDLLAKDLLTDIKKQSNKQKKVAHTNLKAHFEKTIREQAEKTLRKQLLDENVRLQSTISIEAQGEINKYTALIRQAVSERWIIPQVNKKLKVELMIHLAPSGTVLDVQVAKSSGDQALDRSARAAVLKASPLPVPKEAKAFEPFRQFSFTMKPADFTEAST